MPESYFLTTREERIPAHVTMTARCRRRRGEEGAVVEMALRHFPEWGHSELAVCTQDRPGVFSTLAGVLAAAGCNILSARIATAADGMILDQFRISHDAGSAGVGDEDRWNRVHRNIELALAGELDVEQLVLESRRPAVFTRERKGLPTPVTDVRVDNDTSRDYSILDVYAADRVGVLFAITRGLYRQGIRIHLAKISTTLNQVLDVFYVTDENGTKLESGPALERLREDLIGRLQADLGDTGTSRPARASG
jgi:[protein-PII] uridylyltransferase